MVISIVVCWLCSMRKLSTLCYCPEFFCFFIGMVTRANKPENITVPDFFQLLTHYCFVFFNVIFSYPLRKLSTLCYRPEFPCLFIEMVTRANKPEDIVLCCMFSGCTLSVFCFYSCVRLYPLRKLSTLCYRPEFPCFFIEMLTRANKPEDIVVASCLCCPKFFIFLVCLI
jgi:hypothetical protein